MIRAGQLLHQSAYTSQLQTPEWKSFASAIRKERGNACECCRQTNVVTQVHHLFYDPSLKLWEYSGYDVVLLCAACHKGFHAELNNFRKYVFRHMRPEHLACLNKALLIGLTRNDPLEFVHAVSEMAASPGSIQRFAYAWNDGKRPEVPEKYNPTETCGPAAHLR